MENHSVVGDVLVPYRYRARFLGVSVSIRRASAHPLCGHGTVAKDNEMNQLTEEEYQRLKEAVGEEMKGLKPRSMREWEVWEDIYLKKNCKKQSAYDMAAFFGKAEVLVVNRLHQLGLSTYQEPVQETEK